MTEEQLTKHILKWLIASKWEIISFDFPQSGTGIMLHSNTESNHKNKKGIIPDIITVKDNICLFFENKDRFYYQDFEKQNELITGDEYKDSINRILKNYYINNIYYGIGLPSKIKEDNLIENKDLVDFIVTVDPLNGMVNFFYDRYLIKRLLS